MVTVTGGSQTPPPNGYHYTGLHRLRKVPALSSRLPNLPPRECLMKTDTGAVSAAIQRTLTELGIGRDYNLQFVADATVAIGTMGDRLLDAGKRDPLTVMVEAEEVMAGIVDRYFGDLPEKRRKSIQQSVVTVVRGIAAGIAAVS